MIAMAYLAKKKSPYYITFIPTVFMLFMMIWATVYNLNKFIGSQNWLLIFISFITLVITAWMIYESLKSIIAARSQKLPVKDIAEELED